MIIYSRDYLFDQAEYRCVCFLPQREILDYKRVDKEYVTGLQEKYVLYPFKKD